MNERKRQIRDWAVANFKKWPSPFDTNPDGPDAEGIGAEWVYDPVYSSLPFLRCRLGGCWVVDQTDWFYGGGGRK